MTEKNTFRFRAPDDMPPCRIDVFLVGQDLGLSRTAIQRLLKNGKVLLEGRIAKSSDRIRSGQQCLCEISPEILEPRPPLEPKAMDLRILYEDEHLLAVNKPPGISVHPGAGPKTTTLVQGLLSHTSSLSTAGGSDRLGIVHRLDRDTSGVLLVAKNNRVHAALAAQFAERTVKKEYWALTWGPWKRSQLTVVAPLGRPRRNRKKIAVIKGGREAVTRFVVEKDHGFCAEIAAFPFTGRTHQIRVHLAHIHCPVVGDNNYGGSAPRGAFVPALYREKARQLLKLCSRQMLHARRIEFNHPATGQDMALEADFPDDIKEVRRYLAQKME